MPFEWHFSGGPIVARDCMQPRDGKLVTPYVTDIKCYSNFFRDRFFFDVRQPQFITVL